MLGTGLVAGSWTAFLQLGHGVGFGLEEAFSSSCCRVGHDVAESGILVSPTIPHLVPDLLACFQGSRGVDESIPESLQW